MPRFWSAISLVFVAIYFAALFALRFRVPRDFAAYPLTAVLLSVVWAIIFRPQLEHGRMSLAAIFALVTMQAVGLWFAGYMLSFDV
jgi:hypothetical protein